MAPASRPGFAVRDYNMEMGRLYSPLSGAQNDRYASFASRVIVALSSREIGQPAFALSAISLNLAASIPGIFAFRTMCEVVTVQPFGGTLSRLTVAVASRRSGLKPAPPSSAENAIAKQ